MRDIVFIFLRYFDPTFLFDEFLKSMQLQNNIYSNHLKIYIRLQTDKCGEAVILEYFCAVAFPLAITLRRIWGCDIQDSFVYYLDVVSWKFTYTTDFFIFMMSEAISFYEYANLSTNTTLMKKFIFELYCNRNILSIHK